MRKLPIAKNVKSMDIARGTPGFSGADLANLANEAALLLLDSVKSLLECVNLKKQKTRL